VKYLHHTTAKTVNNFLCYSSSTDIGVNTTAQVVLVFSYIGHSEFTRKHKSRHFEFVHLLNAFKDIKTINCDEQLNIPSFLCLGCTGLM
jgi:hypothetical protein